MRQLHHFLKACRIRNTTNEYYRMKFHASLQGAEMCSLESLIGLELESEFDEKTDKYLDAYAEKLLREKTNVRQ